VTAPVGQVTAARVAVGAATAVRWRLLLAGALGVGAAGSAVALMATSAWLISRAAQHPPVLYLMVAIVAVRFFGIARGVLRYAERLVGHDAALRGLRDEAAWERVLRALPEGDALADLPPISEHGAMAGIEDRWRRFAVDGDPVATGVVAVGDAWAATNPTLGRGITLGVIHALHLRDLVRAHLDRPLDLALAWDEVTEREMTPWYRATVWHDRRKARQYAVAAGLAEDVPDPEWDRFLALGAAMQTDLDLAVRFAERQAFLLEPPEALLADDELVAKLDAAPVDWRDHAGPSRAEVLALLAG